MSVAGSRRSARVSARAQSAEPTATPVAAPSRAQDDDRSVVSSRRSNRERNRERNQVTGNGASSYGTKSIDALTDQHSYQATQAQAINSLSGTVGQAQRRGPAVAGTSLSDLTELSEDNLNSLQNTGLDATQNTGLNATQNTGINDIQNTQDDQADINRQFGADPPEGLAPGPVRGSNFMTKVNRWLRNNNAASGNVQRPTGTQQPMDDANSSGQFWQSLVDYGRGFPYYIAHKYPRLGVWFDPLMSLWSFLKLLTIILSMYALFEKYGGQGFGNKHSIRPMHDAAPCVNGICPTSEFKPDMSSFENAIRDQNKQIQDLYGVVHHKPMLPAIDYLSPQNNAHIVPQLTSPQKMRKVTGLMRFFKKETEFARMQQIVGPFKDQKKMWCAPSQHGKAQMTIKMAAAMSPENLFITQSLAYSEALDVDSYPKEIELWVLIRESQVRKAILAEVLNHYPDIQTKTESQENRHLAEDQTLPKSFIPLGRFTYDVRRNQAQQGWIVKTAISRFNVSTTAIAIRINSNWGNLASTCLHQVSLYGEHLDERKIYTDPTTGEIVDSALPDSW